MSKKNEIVDAVIDELQKHGAVVTSIDETRTHPHINFTFKGQTRAAVVPGTPGDVRSLQNARASARHMLRDLGMEWPIPKDLDAGAYAPKKDRTARPKPTAYPNPTKFEDPRSSLADLLAKLKPQVVT